MDYASVNTEHPRIVEAIKRMAADGKKKEEIMRVVGMPEEVVLRHAPRVKSA